MDIIQNKYWKENNIDENGHDLDNIYGNANPFENKWWEWYEWYIITQTTKFKNYFYLFELFVDI